MVYLKAAVAMTLGYKLQGHLSIAIISNGMFCSCRISTDKRVARSLCNSRASCTYKMAIQLLCVNVVCD